MMNAKLSQLWFWPFHVYMLKIMIAITQMAGDKTFAYKALFSSLIKKLEHVSVKVYRLLIFTLSSPKIASRKSTTLGDTT